MGNEEQLDCYELHICIKDYCFAREDRLVGVAVMQLKDIVDKVSGSSFILKTFSVRSQILVTLSNLQHLY